MAEVLVTVEIGISVDDGNVQGGIPVNDSNVQAAAEKALRSIEKLLMRSPLVDDMTIHSLLVRRGLPGVHPD